MHLHKSFILTTIILSFLILPITAFSDVEDILASQQEKKRLESNNNQDGQKAPRGTNDGIQLGKIEFQTTCAVCHGDEGRGDGLFSPQLKVKPKDLTKINARNGGIFPFMKMYKIIDGRENTDTHGSSAMPVWGGRFSAESWFDVSTQYAETVARGKIFELLLYINSIQEN